MVEYLPSLITGGVTAFGSILGFIATTSAQKKNTLKAVEDKVDKHHEEYVKRIDAVEKSISDIKNSTDKWQSNMEIRFDNLEQKVMKHNNFMERVATLEKDVAVLNNREKVSENRLADLEHEHEKA